jgi:hypothetical protein
VPTFRDELLDILRDGPKPKVICHGYQFGCVCDDCWNRTKAQQAPPAPKQPWDVAA